MNTYKLNNLSGDYWTIIIVFSSFIIGAAGLGVFFGARWGWRAIRRRWTP